MAEEQCGNLSVEVMLSPQIDVFPMGLTLLRVSSLFPPNLMYTYSPKLLVSKMQTEQIKFLRALLIHGNELFLGLCTANQDFGSNI